MLHVAYCYNEYYEKRFYAAQIHDCLSGSAQLKTDFRKWGNMERYGNIRFNRRVVVIVCMLVMAVSFLMPKQVVYASTYASENIITIKTTYGDSFKDSRIKLSHNIKSPVYSFILESKKSTSSTDKYAHQLYFGFVSTEDFRGKCSMDWSDSIFGSQGALLNDSYADVGVHFFDFGLVTLDESYQFSGSKSDIFMLYDKSYTECLPSIVKYVTTGQKSDGMIIGGSDTKPTAVTNESMGYLQDVKLNLSYITPIKGDSIF